MGCCISKFSPKTKDFKQVEEPQEKYCYVPEKLFMSRCPSRVSPLHLPDKNRINPIPVPDKFIHIPDKFSTPLSPPVKLSSFSPIKPSTTSNSSLSSSSSSSISTASSISVSKERSFSNDFLRACYQENSHVARINSLRKSSLSLKNAKPGFPSRPNSPVKPNRYSTTPNRANENPGRGTNGYKRTREPSPNNRALTRQKSFRQDQERVIMSSSYSLTKGKFLKSPSPSRRFEGNFLKSPSPSRRFDGNFLKSPSPSKRYGMTMGDSMVSSVSSSLRKDSLDLSLPKTFPKNNRSGTQIHRISSKINDTTMKEVIESHKEPVVPISEELGNPLIDLDCFIFL
ncbi:hypothetical protein EUTSA_v10009526mg [Eutrema salsugineum]|uniref:Uncharacterized protein n=1 Tax=Eutrema salsugineum TaxID=72664 RepID=V4KX68_EUTSA|nr:putative protein TPRXL [Eutrema salsugineum]ESQ34647.1 hypothetical protein EUTSA_v10009526mg [Eutrema salsugineum]